MTTPQTKRAEAMETCDISQRRACRLVSVDPKTVRREPEPDNPKIRGRMREIASERRRFGYRRIGLMLEREGISMNHKKLRRLYKEEGLAVKRRRGRKRATDTREPMPVLDGPSKRWSLNFVLDFFGSAGGSGAIARSTTIHANVLPSWRTPRCQVPALPGNWIAVSGCMAGQKPLSQTMAVS